MDFDDCFSRNMYFSFGFMVNLVQSVPLQFVTKKTNKKKAPIELIGS